MFISDLDAEELTVEQVNKLLFHGIEDHGEQGDCIFVFGSRNSLRYRVPKAVELYKKGRAPKILFSGGMIWEGETLPEALQMKAGAIKLGVDENDILVETDSKHTKENVLASLIVLDRYFSLENIKRLLIVTTTFHMKRCYLTLKTYMPNWIQYTLCPIDDATTGPDDWWIYESGRRRAMAEAKKLVQYVKAGAIIDEQI